MQARTGVPAEIIVSIIGVETSYGGFTGKTRVIDALYTLAFRYPRSGKPERAAYEYKREQFFRDELAQLFALGREENLDIANLTGSYAGAMGLGQFMPSSYREFAVDGDGDGRRDLFNSYDDVFSSIANYFLKKGGERGGWVRGGAVVARAQLQPGFAEFNPETWTPDYTLADLAQRGYRPLDPVAPDCHRHPGVAGRQRRQAVLAGLPELLRHHPLQQFQDVRDGRVPACRRPSPAKRFRRHEVAGAAVTGAHACGLQQRTEEVSSAAAPSSAATARPAPTQAGAKAAREILAGAGRPEQARRLQGRRSVCAAYSRYHARSRSRCRLHRRT